MDRTTSVPPLACHIIVTTSRCDEQVRIDKISLQLLFVAPTRHDFTLQKNRTEFVHRVGYTNSPPVALVRSSPARSLARYRDQSHSFPSRIPTRLAGIDIRVTRERLASQFGTMNRQTDSFGSLSATESVCRYQ